MMDLYHIPHISLICLSLVVKICLINGANGFTCPNIQNKTGPSMPAIPDSYQVDVESKLVEQDMTVQTSIYFDFPGNRAAMKSLYNGSQSTQIFNYATDEIFTIANSDANPSCTVTKISTSNETFFGNSTVNGKIHIGDSQTVWKFGLPFHEVYIGNDTVRGMQVEHWRSCGNQSGVIVTTDYYFTANWTTASTAPNIPVRATIRRDTHLANGTVSTTHGVYDYFNYLPVLDEDPSVFQTPVGVVCPGRINTQMIPPIMDKFYYRVEKVYPDLSAVEFEDVWYDASFRVFRHDYKPISTSYPTYSLNPLSEVHDYTRGVRYIMDKTLGNCTTLPISNYSMDAVQNVTASKLNGSYVLEMKNPLQFFLLNGNYTYIGVRQVRNMFCDAYIANMPNVYIQGFVNSPKTIITVYFLNPSWQDISDNARQFQQTTIPVRMDIQAVESGLTLTYNFVDFDPEPPKLKVFDISQCYHESSKLTFKMTFMGSMLPTLTPTVLDFSQKKLANTMGVSNLRVTNLHLDYDDRFIYITSTLLDRTLASAQFTVIPGHTSGQGGRNINNVVDYEQCATYCLTNDNNFICNGFDFCSDHFCRLSRVHYDSGESLNTSSYCNHFSRNVDGSPAERSLTEAFTALRSTVYAQNYVIDEFTESAFIAVDVAITFGWANVAVSLPSLKTHFSYRTETTYPATKMIIAQSTWYDGDFNLMRYDQHASKTSSLYFTTDPLTIIEDYNTGIRYAINKMQQNCTVNQLSPGQGGAAVTPSGQANATWELYLKSPLQLLHIDNSYRFVGQQTIRGMTCNVFEAEETMPAQPSDVKVLYRYSFLAADWSETDDGLLRSTNQPVRLEATIEQYSKYVQYNMFDFNENTQDLSIFDIHRCFDANQTQPFQIVFPGKFHPALDTTTKMFVIAAVFRLSNVSGASSLRFQRTSVDYDSDNIYLTSSLVQHTSDLIYFTLLPNNTVPAHADRVLEGSTADTCASDCLYETGFTCNSFYLCKESNQCLLSKQHVPDGSGAHHVNGCYSYSRTVKGKKVQLSNMMAFIRLKNAVYSGNLFIDIPVAGTPNTQRFVASSVRNPIRNPYEQNIKEKAFGEFRRVAGHQILKSPHKVLQGLALDDCASACLGQQEFLCDGFSYYPYEDYGYYCSLSRYHPDLMNASQIIVNETGSLYTRNYLTDYHQTAGTVPLTSSANALIPGVQTDEQCAKLCFTNDQMVCRSFQFCQSSGQCLLFISRTVGVPQTYGGPKCNHYASSFERDFRSVNAGLYQFSSVVSSAGVSVQDCADLCVEQQQSQCKGFYYCVHVSNCFLTSDTPGHGTHVNNSNNQLDLCQQYSRIYYPPGMAPPTTSKTTGPTAATVTVKIPTTTTTKTPPTTPSTAAPTQAPSTRPPPSPPSTASSSPSTHVHYPSGVSNIVPTPQQQRHPTTQSTGISIGELVGVSVGMFILGLVLGVVGLHFYRRYRGLDKDLRTNFLVHEDM